MALVLYNSLTRRKERFEPLDPQRVRMYVCGPTVYDRAHIGNARAVVVFDVLYRLLRENYGAGHVRYVRNITDIDDKIIAASRETGEPIAALTERMTRLFHDDMAALGTLPPDLEPRASEHIDEMIAMIGRLLERGCAYVADGHVLFDVTRSPAYGKLSRKSRAELIAGARVEVAPYKRDPGDFVLWKPSPPELPGWESPWGRGRPGWHIECSAMSEKHLGSPFDIHGGGVDLIFPHHENELAQSTCAHDGRPFVRNWVHNGFLTVDGRKMSKSLGNFRTVGELLDEAPIPIRRGETIRLALLSTHYRDPLDWTGAKLHEAEQTLNRWYRALERREGAFDGKIESAGAVIEALQDNLNTPLALAHLHDLAGAAFRASDEAERADRQQELCAGGRLMGLLQESPDAWLQGNSRVSDVGVAEHAHLTDEVSAVVSNPRIEKRIEERKQARKERRFADADRIRAELAAEGIVLEDHPDGTTDWRRER